METTIKLTHKASTLAALKRAGKFGLYGHDLANQELGGHRFGEYIRQLRAEGYVISLVRINKATTKYILEQS